MQIVADLMSDEFHMIMDSREKLFLLSKNLNMRRTKAKRIIKPSKPTEAFDVDDPLVKWEIDCVSSDKSQGETYATSSLKVVLSLAQSKHKSLKRDLSSTQTHIQHLQVKMQGFVDGMKEKDDHIGDSSNGNQGKSFCTIQNSCEIAKARKHKDGNEGPMESYKQHTTIPSFLDTIDDFNANIDVIKCRLVASPIIDVSLKPILEFKTY